MNDNCSQGLDEMFIVVSHFWKANVSGDGSGGLGMEWTVSPFGGFGHKSTRIVDFEKNFNGIADPLNTADYGFNKNWGTDYGIWVISNTDFELKIKLFFRIFTSCGPLFVPKNLTDPDLNIN